MRNAGLSYIGVKLYIFVSLGHGCSWEVFGSLKWRLVGGFW